MYVGQTGDNLLDVVRENPAIDRVVTVSAGKLRRYSGEGWRQLLDVRTQLLNIRDVFRTGVGVWQAYRLIGAEKPAVVFTRGGFVSVPVALAARLRGVPYITHDADSVPSLANRLIARWAARHAVTLPAEAYPYAAEKTVVTGIPVGPSFHAVTDETREVFKKQLDLQDYGQVLLITGGGNGARALNTIVVANTKYLLSHFSDLVILHFCGRALEAETNNAYDALELGGARSRVKVYGFAPDFYKYSGAADVVVARGGMGSLAEFAVQQAACVVVPSPQLGWNVKNSRALAAKGMVVELTEEQAEQPERLGRTVAKLLQDSSARRLLGEKLGAMAKPMAAKEIADLVEEVGKGE